MRATTITYRFHLVKRHFPKLLGYQVTLIQLTEHPTRNINDCQTITLRSIPCKLDEQIEASNTHTITAVRDNRSVTRDKFLTGSEHPGVSGSAQFCCCCAWRPRIFRSANLYLVCYADVPDARYPTHLNLRTRMIRTYETG